MSRYLSLSTDHRTAVDEAASIVRSGGVLVYPTATVYGIGGDARNESVAERIGRIKGRDRDKPMLVLTDTWDRVRAWLADLDEVQNRLMNDASFEGLTIVFRASASAPVRLRGSAPGIGVRKTIYPFCLELIGKADAPLISTSANRSGDPAAADVEAVARDVLDGVDLVVDAGRPLAGTASTVVEIVEDAVHVLREGAVKADRLRAAGYPVR